MFVCVELGFGVSTVLFPKRIETVLFPKRIETVIFPKRIETSGVNLGLESTWVWNHLGFGVGHQMQGSTVMYPCSMYNILT